MENKKAVELSMQTIVIVIALLITIIVVIMIFSGQMGKNMGNAEAIRDGVDCNTYKVASGTCTARSSCGTDETQQFGNFKQNKEGMVCCCPKPE